MSWFSDHQAAPDPSGLLQGQGDDRFSYDDARAAIKHALDVYGAPSDDASVNSLMNAVGIRHGEVSYETLSGIFKNLHDNAVAQYGPNGENYHAPDAGSGGSGGASGGDHGSGVDTQYGHLSGEDKDAIDKMLDDVQSTDDRSYWYGVAAQHGGVQATGSDWLNDRIRRGDGSMLVKNGTLQKVQDGGGSYGGVVGTYTTPTRPADLQTFTPQTWDETYKQPTAADLQNDPGYLAQQDAIRRGLTNSAAAKGSALNADFTGRTLSNTLDQNAAASFENLNNRAFASYQQRYNQFMNTNSNNADAFKMNQNTYNTDVANSLNQYLTRYGAYQDLIKNNLSYADLGLRATTAGNPGSTGSGA